MYRTHKHKYETLVKKKSKKDLNKWRDVLCSWMEDNIIKMSILPNLIYTVNAIQNKIPASYFADTDSKFYMEKKMS